MHLRFATAASCLALLGACSAPLPEALPALVDFERPLVLAQEPDDEAERLALDPGCFSGLRLSDARDTLEALVGDTLGVRVSDVVENSPAHAAGIQPGDLVLEAEHGDGVVTELRWASEWRAIELAAQPGTRLSLLVDRAGRELELELTLVARIAAAPRTAALLFEETERVGVALRQPTEVEARAHGLAPGAGAVVIGLARSSPWRAVGIGFEDVVVELDGVPLGAPQALLDAIRAAKVGAELQLTVAPLSEPEARRSFAAPVSRRETATREIYVPLLYKYEREGPGRSRWSALLGIVTCQRTPVAWRMRLLWFLRFGRGDTERLLELEG